MNEFDELNELLLDMEEGLSSANRYVGTVTTKVDQITRSLENSGRVSELIRNLLDKHYSAGIVNETVDLVFGTILDSAESILLGQLEIALDTSAEYGREPFKSRLLEACSNPEIFRIGLRGTGWRSEISVHIDLNESAGNIEMWANAIDAVRDSLDVNKRYPARNSNYWRNVIYDSEDYDATIDLRLEIADSIAPFWELLEYGSGDTSMSSSYGGRAYPVQKPTHFISDAEEAIINQFHRTLSRAYSDFISFEDKVLSARGRVNELIRYGNELIESIYESAQESVETMGESQQSLAEAQTYVQETEATKLEKVLEDLRQNGTIVNFRVTKDGRVEVTEPGSKKRVRKSVAMLMKYKQGG